MPKKQNLSNLRKTRAPKTAQNASKKWEYQIMHAQQINLISQIFRKTIIKVHTCKLLQKMLPIRKRSWQKTLLKQLDLSREFLIRREFPWRGSRRWNLKLTLKNVKNNRMTNINKCVLTSIYSRNLFYNYTSL